MRQYSRRLTSFVGMCILIYYRYHTVVAFSAIRVDPYKHLPHQKLFILQQLVPAAQTTILECHDMTKTRFLKPQNFPIPPFFHNLSLSPLQPGPTIPLKQHAFSIIDPAFRRLAGGEDYENWSIED
jgi:hypothetical protein